jgi:hypothetical protein
MNGFASSPMQLNELIMVVVVPEGHTLHAKPDSTSL